jgi:hypothetical protein
LVIAESQLERGDIRVSVSGWKVTTDIALNVEDHTFAYRVKKAEARNADTSDCVPYDCYLEIEAHTLLPLELVRGMNYPALDGIIALVTAHRRAVDARVKMNADRDALLTKLKLNMHQKILLGIK